MQSYKKSIYKKKEPPYAYSIARQSQKYFYTARIRIDTSKEERFIDEWKCVLYISIHYKCIKKTSKPYKINTKEMFTYSYKWRRRQNERYK